MYCECTARKAQHIFDKTAKCKKRHTLRNKVLEIEKANTEDPKAFWRFIKNLNPRTKKTIPWETIDNDGNIITDKSAVLAHWSSEFGKLLTPPPPTPQMTKHLQDIAANNRIAESNFDENTDAIFNKLFSVEEIGKLVRKSKKNRAPGIDGVVYDVLKNTTAIRTLTSLFNHCYKHHFVPDSWKQGVISSIPKGNTSDLRIPLSYRGISLLSVVGKLYTAGLSNRLSKHLENNNLLITEQNGF